MKEVDAIDLLIVSLKGRLPRGAKVRIVTEDGLDVTDSLIQAQTTNEFLKTDIAMSNPDILKKVLPFPFIPILNDLRADWPKEVPSVA
jgi:hypothetical protein